MLPLPAVQRPATARKRLDLPAPEFPTMSRFSPSRRSIDRSEIRVRLRSGVERSRCFTDNRGALEGRRYDSPAPPSVEASWDNACERTNSMVPKSSALFSPLAMPFSLLVGESTTPPFVTVAFTAAAVCETAVAFGNFISEDMSLGPSRLFLRTGSASCMACKKTDNRSMPAENRESCSNWFTMMLRSFRMWLKAPTDWLMTPSSMAPAKYRGATTVTGNS
mmetsp:Transcript_3900/g.9419  ORF Transcript_3900/g.9419 Transcript_3900/m.9419 type:complete len:221 (+) Transcript_3900:685-1347(+)